MDKFKIAKPNKAPRKSQFNFLMEDDMQLWVRQLAADHDVSIGEIMHQALEYARNHYSRR